MNAPLTTQNFKGTVGRTLADSEAHFEDPPHPGEGAPNVVIVLLDDTGFAQFGCFGSDIDTPNVDALAADGLQYTNFHVAPLCSPTRASLLTGRSQHAVGMRGVSNWRTGFPNQLGHISNHAATVAEVLKAEGYGTYCVGKWHLAPTQDISAAGPFDQWPLARGFDRFYGFLEGETDQFHPELVIDNHKTEPPATAEEGYHLSEDMVDQLLLMLSDSKGVRPDRPFFAYVPFGATHAPHQAPQAYLDKYKGRYDEGWDVIRQRWFDRQIKTGVIPEGTQLAPRNPGVEAWDTLPESHQKFACRLQEAFAAFLDHTDDQIGRLVEGIRNMGELDNTIFVVLADNGASQEGGPFGVMHEMKFFNGLLEDPDDVMDRLDDIGGPDSHTNYPWGWSQCGNSPFKWYKQNTHEGGVHVPMVFHWPAGIDQSQAGTKRNQFVNVSDITPTIYEILGVTAPEVFKGIDQMPVTGDSFVSTLSDPAAPATNTIQYFENGGSRALIVEQDGVWWKAVARHQAGVDFEDDTWELYRLSDDMSECNDVAGDSPDKLTELIELWWSEAERNGVLPLDDRGLELFAPHLSDTSPHRLDRTYVYRPPMSPIPAQPSPSPGGRSWDMTASVTRAAGDEGVIWATGSASSGISIFVQNDRLLIDYNSFDERTVLESDIVVPEGDCVLGVSLARNSRTTGIMSIAIDGEAAGSAELPFMMRMISSLGASVGMDFGSQVSQQYTGTFPFTGTLHQIEIQLGQRSRKDAEATAKTEMSRQ